MPGIKCHNLGAGFPGHTIALVHSRIIAIIEEDDMATKTTLQTWQTAATDAALALTATDATITSAKDGLLSSFVGALSEGETSGTWRLAIEQALGYEHRLYDAGTNSMITCDGAKVPPTLRVCFSEAARAYRVLTLEQIIACDTWQEMKAAAAAADPKKAPESFAEKYKIASGMAKKSDSVAASLAKVLSDWIATQ